MLALVLAWNSLGVLRDPLEHGGLFGGLTLALHEMGHVLFGFTQSEWWTVAGGSITQIAAPITAALLLRRQGDRFGMAVLGFWLSASLSSLALYAGDARDQALPLVSIGDGDGEVQHDWTYLLGRAGWLNRDTTVEHVIRGAGWCVWVITACLCAWMIIEMREQARREGVAN